MARAKAATKAEAAFVVTCRQQCTVCLGVLQYPDLHGCYEMF
jgi:hypothetical protein